MREPQDLNNLRPWRHFLATGLSSCFDSTGAPIKCRGSGQDAEFSTGLAWPEPRFGPAGEGIVLDHLTGLMWTQNASPAEFPLNWAESFDAVEKLNASRYLGHEDWRLPNRRELRSLISHGAKNPALPHGHPFTGVVGNWYWTSSSSALAPDYAWYVHLAGGRMFYGKKDSAYMLWPVRGVSPVLPRTGRAPGPDGSGPAAGDSALRTGVPWPEPRFEDGGEEVLDRLTGLVWLKSADLTRGLGTWDEALAAVRDFSIRSGKAWRLPNINELESLVDASRAAPALPEGHPFAGSGQAYWSSTSSFYEPDWSYCLYLDKGAVGVGFKPGREFLAWPVRDGEGDLG